MAPTDPKFTLRLALDADDLRAAQRLRYRVFVEELGGGGAMVDHDAKLECDRFDPYCDHLILIDDSRDPENLDHVVGVYRLLNGKISNKAGGFYTEGEYDLGVLRKCGKSLLELGRSCVHADYRGGKAMYLLWVGLADYVQQHRIDILFGVASFHGTEVSEIAGSLSLLRHKFLAPKELRVRVRDAHYQTMNLTPPHQIDRPGAMRATPALIKAYLRLGGFVGDGAFVDHVFNTIDVCLVMDTSLMNKRQRGLYTRAMK